MTDREKLTEVIYAMDICSWDWAGKIADHLLSNGVTFQKWISVSERLPEPFELVYVYVPTEHDVTHAYMTRHKEWVGVRMNREVTHWMPLPEPPQEK